MSPYKFQETLENRLPSCTLQQVPTIYK